MAENSPSRTLTIHLAKENRRPQTLIRHTDGLIEKRIPVGGRVIGRLFIKPPEGRPPSWVDFFKPFVTNDDVGDVRSSSAVLLVPVYRRWAAVTFGQGRHLLSPDAFEDRFGLKVALNCIDERKIRSIDKQTFDAIASHTVEQASQEANAREFGFDIERDMLRAVTGTPRHPDYGIRLTGMDSLSTVVRIELNELHDLLDSYHMKFFDDSYRLSFPWVDQIQQVTDQGLEDSLNEAVIKLIRKHELNHCWLAVPDMIDWSIISGFRYSTADKRPQYDDIHLGTFLRALMNPVEISLSNLRQRRVFCMGHNDEIIKSWSVFNCLYCELDHADKSYVLNAGNWYSLEHDFVRTINESFARVPMYPGSFLDFDDDSEAHYNERLVRNNSETYCLMDRQLTYRGGPIEFCDVFSKNKELIHVKRYGESATLSHLFCQGVVSAEFFQMDKDYRRLVQQKLPAAFRKLIHEDRPKSEEYHVIYAIISRSNKNLTMPFFSRVGIRHAIRRLEGLGYSVSLAKIGVTQARTITERIRPKAKTRT
jgi:uncharacterized protein (TIGR04141 family)